MCDELTTYTFDDMLDGIADIDVEYYLKSEADEVIAHNKYKRCLAMARMCEERSARYDALQEGHDLDWRREIEFYYKWYMRWLELAMKFELKNGVNNA